MVRTMAGRMPWSSRWRSGESRDFGVRVSEEEAAFLRKRLADLHSEHRDLDDVIARLEEAGPTDFLQIQRLKKRKLRLKDEMAQIESRLLPDIIA